MPELPIGLSAAISAGLISVVGAAAASSPKPWGTGSTVVALIVAGYLPFYIDGSPCHGRRAGAAIGASKFARWMWTKFMGLPLAEVHWNAKDFASKDAKGQQQQQYVFASHPHGVASLHHIGLMMCPATCQDGRSFSDLSPIATRRDLGASVLFRLPLFREAALLAGTVDAGKAIANRMLREGKSLGILVGGEREQLLSMRGEHTAFIKHRKGFCKLALKFGAPAVPCYCFGETDLYSQSTFLLGARMWLARTFGVAITFAKGRSWLMPWLPYKVKLNQVVGAPLPLPERFINNNKQPAAGAATKKQVVEPTDEEVNAYHAAYVAALVALFEAHKAKYGCADKTLKIV